MKFRSRSPLLLLTPRRYIPSTILYTPDRPPSSSSAGQCGHLRSSEPTSSPWWALASRRCARLPRMHNCPLPTLTPSSGHSPQQKRTCWTFESIQVSPSFMNSCLHSLETHGQWTASPPAQPHAGVAGQVLPNLSPGLGRLGTVVANNQTSPLRRS